MDKKEAALYEEMKKDLILPFKEGEMITAANAAALSGKLSQMHNCNL
ncbi:hypothetical protein SAMN02910451_00708 [Butyrivibrio hungatei]|uniref:Uncharacterized protein n=1 Tax=Butyrivibrio hungatei TaxID=185008 RepID=A0A1G5BFP2_9FIRM|nr:hypothetical protein [Butyrivibrio hungatei]SCX88946.1 hypothetical protein SAMN02910451_00708 [Butyrivibrio hungatei]